MNDIFYGERAEQHMPKMSAEVAAAARELGREERADHDIARILRLGVMPVRRLTGADGVYCN